MHLEFLKNNWIKLLLIILIILFLFWLLCLNYNEPTEIGIARNLITGKMWLQRGGLHLTWPWVLVPRIDTRPMKVVVDSAGHGFSGKLIQFVPEEWEKFVEIEGWRLWWFANRLSFNWGYEYEHRGIKDILRGYAYGTKKYPFLIIIEELEQQE